MLVTFLCFTLLKTFFQDTLLFTLITLHLEIQHVILFFSYGLYRRSISKFLHREDNLSSFLVLIRRLSEMEVQN